MTRASTMKIQSSFLNSYVCSSCRRNLRQAQQKRFLSSRGTPPDIYDIVAVGGGPVGLALLAALRASPATAHLKTALIESQDLSNAARWILPQDQYSNRASSLTPASVTFLKRIGAWEHVDHSRVQPYDEMQVWDGSNGAHIQFEWNMESQKYGAPPQTVATMTENANLTRGLLARIRALSQGEEHSLLSNTTVSVIDNGIDDPDGLNLSSWPILTLSDTSGTSSHSKVAARLLIGADGLNSPLRSFAGIASNGWDYNRHGVVATLTLQPEEESLESFFSDTPASTSATAYQRFLPALGGPVALLPLPNNRASVVWSTTPQNAAYLKSLPEGAFVAMINAAFRLSMTDLSYMLTLPAQPATPDTYTHADELSWRLEHTSVPRHVPPLITSLQPGSLASFPLRFRHASTYIAPRIALVGDAAHTIHPLAGQGLNLGLSDARSLASTIEYAVEHGQDLGDLMTLERYNRECWGRNAKVGGACDAFHRVYGVEGGPVAWGTRLGMNLVGELPWVKGWVMKQAEG